MTNPAGTPIEALLDELIDCEGGYVNHPPDRGGPTRYGITEAVARTHGYRGAIRALPVEEAKATIAGSTGFGRASSWSRHARRQSRLNCSTPESTWGRRWP